MRSELSAVHVFSTHSSPNSFLLHYVQLSGRISLLGAEQVTWRFGSPATNIVAGGNGSGKSLLCSAICAALFPTTTSVLRQGLSEAGLASVTIVGQSGPKRREWTLDIHSGELVHRSPQTDEENEQRPPIEAILLPENSPALKLPHVIVNGAWVLPDRSSIAWAKVMQQRPILRELMAWERRLDALLGNASTEGLLTQARTELVELESELQGVRTQRARLEQAEQSANDFMAEISEYDLRLNVAQAEEVELGAKIELAERVVRLENWAEELRSSWRTVENSRERYAVLQERLESLQELTRGLPDDAHVLAEEYLNVSTQHQAVCNRISLSETERRSLENSLTELSLQLENPVTDEQIELGMRIEQNKNEIGRAEEELKDLSRQRIDLLRRHEGLLRTRQEKFKEMTLLRPDEWRELDAYLENRDTESLGSPAASEELVSELQEIRTKLEREFKDFGALPKDTPDRVDQLFRARAQVTAIESELLKQRESLVNEENRPLKTGMTFALTTAGSLGAGLPAGLMLGADVGFFGAVLGGGVGYGVAQLILPANRAGHEGAVQQVESLQKALQSALQERVESERAIAPLDKLLSPESAKRTWEEYVALRDRANALEQQLSHASATVERENNVPKLLRKLETEEIRRRVSEFRDLNSQIERAELALREFEAPTGAAGRMQQIESALHNLHEQTRLIERDLAEITQNESVRRTRLTSEKNEFEAKLRALSGFEEDARLRDSLASRLGELDQMTNGVLSQRGAQTILAVLGEREGLLSEIREVKSQLSTAHAPQELAARTELVEAELEQLMGQLRDIDPLFATSGSGREGLAKYRAQLERVREQIRADQVTRDRREADIAALELQSLRDSLITLPSESELQEAVTRQLAKISELERSISAAANMCDALRAESAEIAELAEANVLTRLREVVFEHMGEKVAAVELNESEWVAILEDGQRRPLQSLPRGVAELAALCLNSGLLSCSEPEETTPIIWDDVFSQLDDYLLTVAHRVIEKIAQKRQVILLTRDLRIRSWGQAADVLAGRQEFDVQMN